MTEERSLLSRIVTWTLLGLLVVVLVKVALRLLSFLFGVAGMLLGLVLFLAFTAGPIVLLGWLGTRAYRAYTKPRP